MRVVENPNTLVAVSAYAGDLHQVENNLPFYLHHGCPVIILSPSDAPITKVSARNVHCRWEGRAGWIGAHTLERQRRFLEILLATPQEHFLFRDADSICFSPKLPGYLYEQDILWSNEVVDTNPGPSKLPKLALQPPYFFSRTVLRALLAAAVNPPTSYYGGVTEYDGCPIPTECIDHWMLQVACGSGLPHRNFLDGASWETTSPGGLNEMARVVRGGRNFIHQVKSKLVLNRLAAEYASRK
jgi:hypothetical protein